MTLALITRVGQTTPIRKINNAGENLSAATSLTTSSQLSHHEEVVQPFMYSYCSFFHPWFGVFFSTVIWYVSQNTVSTKCDLNPQSINPNSNAIPLPLLSQELQKMRKKIPFFILIWSQFPLAVTMESPRWKGWNSNEAVMAAGSWYFFLLVHFSLVSPLPPCMFSLISSNLFPTL